MQVLAIRLRLVPVSKATMSQGGLPGWHQLGTSRGTEHISLVNYCTRHPGGSC